MANKIVLLGAGAIAVGVVSIAWVAVSGNRGGDGIASSSVSSSPQQFETSDPLPSSRGEGISHAELEVTTVESVLKAYWGDEWPLVKARLEAEGQDLQASFELRQPWEEVEASIKEGFVPQFETLAPGNREFYLEWPSEVTLESLQTTFRIPEGFTESDLYLVEEIAARFNPEIEAISDTYTTGLCSVLEEKWARGQVLHTPFSTRAVPIAANPQDNFYAASSAHGSGWTVKVCLSKQDYPDLVAMKEEMQGLQGRRDKEIRQFFHRWRR